MSPTSVPEDEFEFDRAEDLEAEVFQALGAASMCWSQRPRGIFESQRAKAIGDALVARMRARGCRMTAP